MENSNKKSFLSKFLIVFFILVFLLIGIIFSDYVKQGINGLLNKNIFETLKTKQEKIINCKNKIKQRKQLIEKIKNDLSKLTEANIKEKLMMEVTGKELEKEKYKFKKPSDIREKLREENKDLKEINSLFKQKMDDIINVASSILQKRVNELNQELVSINAKLSDKNQKLNKSLNELEEYKSKLEQQKQINKELKELEEKLKEKVKGLEVKLQDGRIRVNFKGDILFDSGKAVLKKEGEKQLNQIIPDLLANKEKYNIFVAGHTDNVPIKEEYRYKYKSNWELSTFRAVEVLHYLVDKGIPPENITAAGYGKFKPIADNSTKEGRTKNRRVEIFLIPKIIKR